MSLLFITCQNHLVYANVPLPDNATALLEGIQDILDDFETDNGDVGDLRDRLEDELDALDETNDIEDVLEVLNELLDKWIEDELNRLDGTKEMEQIRKQLKREFRKDAKKLKDAINDTAGLDHADKLKAKLDAADWPGECEELENDLKAKLEELKKEYPYDSAGLKKAYLKYLNELADQGHLDNPMRSIIEDCLKKLKEHLNDLLDNAYVSMLPSGEPMITTTAAVGTGRTTGHIASLSVINNSDQEITLSPMNYYIPSTGRYQSYVGTAPKGTTVPPNGSVVVPIEGYCADIKTPPVPTGEAMPSTDDWITIAPSDFGTDTGVPLVVGELIPGISSSWQPKEENGWVPAGSGVYPSAETTPPQATNPSNGEPLGHTISGSNLPELARVVSAAKDQIEDAYDQLENDANINTPFSSDLEKQKASVVQQVVWIYGDALTNTNPEDAYTYATFEGKTWDQYEEKSGVSREDVPVDVKENIEGGVQDFWNTFTAVGVEAKVISVDKITED